MTSERKKAVKAVEEALTLDKALGPSKARVLRAIQVLTAAHQDDPEWRGASATEIGDAAGVSERWARTQAEWLFAAGFVEAYERRDVPWRPTRLYRAKQAA